MFSITLSDMAYDLSLLKLTPAKSLHSNHWFHFHHSYVPPPPICHSEAFHPNKKKRGKSKVGKKNNKVRTSLTQLPEVFNWIRCHWSGLGVILSELVIYIVSSTRIILPVLAPAGKDVLPAFHSFYHSERKDNTGTKYPTNLAGELGDNQSKYSELESRIRVDDRRANRTY